MKKFLLAYIPICLLIYVIIGCTNGEQNKKNQDISDIVSNQYNKAFKEALDTIAAAKKLIHNGDLICRTGFDYISRSLQSFNTQDKTYSHSGLAFIENGQIMVYHSIAGQDENPDECFKKEPLDSFINPEKRAAFGIFRYKISEAEISCIYERFKDLEKRKVKFDKYFNLKDDEKQYCSEAIYKALLNCTNQRIKLPTTIREKMHVKTQGYEQLEGKKFEYIALDNLYLNPYCDAIEKVTFKIGYAKPKR